MPAELADMEPGPRLGGLLAGIDVDRLSGFDRIVVLKAHDRQTSHLQTHRCRVMAAVVDVMEDDDPRWAAEAAAAEIRAALRLTRNASDGELVFALDLRQRLPGVWEALAAGEIDLRRAKLLWHRTVHLSVTPARGVIERAIEAAPHLTTGQLKARIDRLCVEADPAAAEDRYRYAVHQRRIVAEPTDAGTANLLGLDLPPQRVAAITRRINRLARDLNTAGESRTMDQLRADVFLDLLASKSKERKASGGGVHIQTDLDTLTALAEHPGELEGYGPVIADIARQVTQEQHDAEWRYTITDTATGQPVHTGVTRRRPTVAQRRRVETRNTTGVFPGCRMPSVACDLDHRTRWADGGHTTCCNLAPLCRLDHLIKDKTGWSYRPLSQSNHEWSSRLGHTYTTSGLPP